MKEIKAGKNGRKEREEETINERVTDREYKRERRWKLFPNYCSTYQHHYTIASLEHPSKTAMSWWQYMYCHGKRRHT